jgi:hypothetical protein
MVDRELGAAMTPALCPFALCFASEEGTVSALMEWEAHLDGWRAPYTPS